MKTNRSSVNLILQCGLLVLLSLFSTYLLKLGLWFCTFFAFLLILATILYINQQQQRKQEALKKFIASIHFNDYSLSFGKKEKNTVDSSLTLAMQQALSIFRERIYTLEEEHLYYQTLLSTIDSGIIIINQKHEIEWCNKAALSELQLTSLHQLSDLQAIQQNLPEILLNLKAGDIRIIRLNQEDHIREIAFNTILFRVKGKTLSLISLKNIHSVLEYNEIEAWQKLISVLTHEIMNSMAPIISLSETLIERSTDQSLSSSSINQQALQAIHRRSKGLLEFVQNYRKLTKIPAPHFKSTNVSELFSHLQKLHSSSDIQYRFICQDPHLQLLIDQTQIEQVLINLIRNAEEACISVVSPKITISAFPYPDKTILSVRDNGPGIIPEALDKIFVPFFTTKSGGSGIGLSLCKQIMTLHHSHITVSSKPGEGADFQLIFHQA